MDDTELGRPPRHERAKKSAAPKAMAGILDRGDGVAVKIDESRTCSAEGCRRKVRVEAEGPEDSMLVRLARMRLAGELLCEPCGDEREAEEARAAEAETTVAQIRRRLDASGIPERWRTLTFDRLDRDEERAPALDAAREWGRGQRRRGVLLWGDVGRGKTVIAAAAAVERAAAIGPTRWLSVAELLLDLRMPFAAPEYARAARKLKPTGRPALVLDDLDKLKPTEHALQPLYVAINGWIEAGLPLMVTLNRSIDELAGWGGETFGDALASRLGGYCDVFEVRGRDRRLS